MSVILSVAILAGTLVFIIFMMNAEERHFSPPRHAYAGLPQQWTVFGATERFADKLKEWNDESKDSKGTEAVDESMSVRFQPQLRTAFYAALAGTSDSSNLPPQDGARSARGIQGVALAGSTGRAGSPAAYPLVPSGAVDTIDWLFAVSAVEGAGS